MRKVSDDPPNCAILWPRQTTATYTVTHNVETGEVTIDTGSGVFAATLDENNCGQLAECLTSPDIFCSDGCTYTFAGCFSEGDPPTVAGSAHVNVHDPNSELCGGDISCTVVYDVSGERAEALAAETQGGSGPSRAAGGASQPAQGRTGLSVWKSVRAFLARLGRVLGLRAEPAPTTTSAP
jgi:hypothetical protein